MRGKRLFVFLATLLCLSGMASVAAAQVAVPYFEDFESEPTCGAACTSACTLSTTGWTNLTADDLDWGVDTNGTTSSGTGPEDDHTLGVNGGGNYLYTEGTSCDLGGETALLVSPLLDLTSTTAPTVQFWYHMLGDDMGTMHVDILDASMNVLASDIISSFTDNVDLWQQTPMIDLSAYNGQQIHVQIRGVLGAGFETDMAIDDFSFFELPVDDLGVVSIDAPGAMGCGLGANELVTVTIENFGSASQSSFDVQFNVDGNMVTETVPGPIAAFSTLQYTFTGTGDFSMTGSHSVSATTLLAGDENAGNDSASSTVETLPIFSQTLFDNLEGPNAATDYIHGGVEDEWELGTPSDTAISNANSGSNAWVTDLNANYSSSADNWIQTAYCMDLSGFTTPELSIAINVDAETGFDGAVLQTSVDDGASWQNLGAFNDGAPNWFNEDDIDAMPGGSLEGWSTSDGDPGSEEWLIAQHSLASLSGESQVLFRIAFASDSIITDEGFAWDDLAIYDANVEQLYVSNGPLNASLGATMAGATDVLVQALDLTGLGSGAQTVTGLTITKAGTIMDSYLTAKLYADDGDGFFDAAVDTLVDTQVVANGAATFTGSVSVPNGAATRVFVAYDVDVNAMPGDTFGSTVAMASNDVVTTAAVIEVDPPFAGPLLPVAGIETMLPFTDDFSTTPLNRTVMGAAGGTFPLASMAGTAVTMSGATPNDALFELLMSHPDTPLTPVEGTHFFAMSYPDGEATGALDYAFDLSAFTAATNILWLQYRFADTGEESDDTDNIFISLDGGANWAASLRYFDWSDPADTWVFETLDVSAALTAAALDYTNDVIIRFQASDDFDLDLDGFAVDRVTLGRAPQTQLERPAMTPIADGGMDMAGQIAAAPQSFMYTITNLGDFPLTIDDTSFASANETNVTNLVITAPASTTVAPMGTETFQVDFEPGVGAFSFDLSFTTDDPYIADNLYNITVGGEGLEEAAEIDVQRPAGTSIASGMTDSQGDLEVGMTEMLTYTIENVGFGVDLNVSGVEIQNATNVTASVDSQPDGVLAPGATSAFDVSFSPDAEGAWSFDVVVNNDDSDENPYTVTVDGTATDPNMGTGGGGMGGMPGTGGSGGDPGTGGSGGDPGTGGSDAGDADDDGGCGCSTPGSQDNRMSAAFGLWLLGLAFASRRTRRRR